MSYVEFKNLEMRYEGVAIPTLKNISLNVKEGEFIVVVGPSGCGKSTMLKVLSGLEEISNGELLIDGEIINDKEPKDRQIGMVFQNYALYPHFTVKKNISFSLKKLGFKKDEINKKVKDVGEMLAISDQFDKMPKDLSGGQQQRVALARTIVRDPKIYLFDEPLSNLDAKLRTKTREDIVNMHKELKKTFFYVTHDQVEAMTMADRIIILKDGVIQQVDKPINIFYNPKNLFVAKFIGVPEINIFKAQVNKEIILENEYKIKISNDKKEILKDYSNVYIGIRPDDIKYSVVKKENYYKLQIKSREILGNTTIVNGIINMQKLNVVIRTVDFIQSMENIYIDIDIKECYFFDINTKENLNAIKNNY